MDLRALSQFRTLISEAMERAGFARNANVTFNGTRDMNAVLGYRKTLTVEDFRFRYKRNSIAGRVVEAMPKATWRGGGEIIESENPKEITDFEKAWIDLSKRLKIWSTFARADILSGIGRYGIILIGAPVPSGGSMESPLPKALRPQDVLYLKPYAEDEAQIEDKDVDTNLRSERFGRPTFYTLKRANTIGVRTQSLSEKRVHWTRVIHIADNALDDELFGQPRLERVWNELDDLEKIRGGGAEAFWMRANQGTQFDVDPEMELTTEGKTEMEEQINEYVDGMRRILRTRGVKINQLGSDVANIDPNIDAILTLISGGTGIPKRILTGSEMGELASTQDRSNWAERVSDRRKEFAEPQVVQQLVDRFVEYKILPAPDQFSVRWPEIQNLDQKERADVALKWAELNSKAGQVVVDADEIRDHCLGLPSKEIAGVEDDDDLDQDDDEEDDLIDEEDPNPLIAAKLAIRRRANHAKTVRNIPASV